MAHGRPFADVAREPWRLTLYTFAMLREREVIEDRLQTVERIREAHRMACAFHDPKRLERMEQQALGHLMTQTVTDREYIAEKIAAIRANRARGEPVPVDGLGC